MALVKDAKGFALTKKFLQKFVVKFRMNHLRFIKNKSLSLLMNKENMKFHK